MKKTKSVKRKNKIVKKIPDNEKYKLEDWHPNHDKHMCHIMSLRNLKTAAKLAKDSQYICMICGRAAKNKKNLCEPVKI